jgi:hypothetical protein
MSDITNDIRDMNAASFAPVGRCIFCDSTENLTREHIVPFALSGTAVLPKASCRCCAKITGRFEQEVLRGPMWAVRVFRSLRSRSKHADAPVEFPLTVERNGETSTLSLPVKDYPILLYFPLFAPPAHIAPEGYTSGIHTSGVASVSFGKRPDEVKQTLNASSLSIPSEGDHPVAFARMLAKIGYAMAVGQNQADLIDGKPYVLPAILGASDDIGRWVGTLTKPIQKHPGVLHRVDIMKDQDRGLLAAEVQLFADSETPAYGVILGKLKNNAA